MDHEEVNGYLTNLKESEGLDVQLSYDGLRIPVRLAWIQCRSTNDLLFLKGEYHFYDWKHLNESMNMILLSSYNNALSAINVGTFWLSYILYTIQFL